MAFLNKIKKSVVKFFSKRYKKFQKIFSYLYLREKIIVFILALIVIVAFSFLMVRIYFYLTLEVPIQGGSYTEAITGQPKDINPLFSSSNLPDRALTYLLYSGLTKVDENGNVVSDLAESWEVKNDGKQYIFKLRKNVKWHDGEQLMSNDILYTISVIQDPDYLGPLKDEWKDIDVEIPDEFTVIFNLPKPQQSFIYSAATLGILPEHVWAGTEVSNLSYVDKNLKPIGTGKFRFKEIKTSEDNFIQSIVLERNDDFYAKKPLLDSVVLNFYKSDEESFDALVKKEVLGLGGINSQIFKEASKLKRLRILPTTLPAYKAVFINSTSNPLLAVPEFKAALDLVIDREKLTNEKLKGIAFPNDGIFPEDKFQNNFNLSKAKELLSGVGLKEIGKDGFLKKDGKTIELKLNIGDDQESEEVSEFLKESWKQIGINLKITKNNLADLERDVIRPRNYELLFFGQNLGFSLDPFPFWHSSQRKDLGLNLTSYSSKKVDVLLENAENTDDESKKKEILAKTEEALKQDKPAIFLYSSVYNFITDKNLKGLTKHFLIYPEHRFINIEDWYIKTKRILNFSI